VLLHGLATIGWEAPVTILLRELAQVRYEFQVAVPIGFEKGKGPKESAGETNHHRIHLFRESTGFTKVNCFADQGLASSRQSPRRWVVGIWSLRSWRRGWRQDNAAAASGDGDAAAPRGALFTRHKNTPPIRSTKAANPPICKRRLALKLAALVEAPGRELPTPGCVAFPHETGHFFPAVDLQACVRIRLAWASILAHMDFCAVAFVSHIIHQRIDQINPAAVVGENVLLIG